MKMKIAFFWTWDFSASILSSLIENDSVEIWLVVSQPDKPVGRKKIITPTPVKLVAQEHNIEVLQPEKLKNNQDFFDTLTNNNFDFIIVVAYGKIVPVEVLQAPKHGCINIHGSILPKYRWASPIQEAVKNWDEKTWITIMYMSEAMDEWDILHIHEVDIFRDDTTQDIFEKFSQSGPKVLVETLQWVLNWEITPIKQNESEASYCSKIEKSDGEIDFNQPAQSIYNTFKAYKAWPGIYSYYNDKKFTLEECDYLDVQLDLDDDFNIWDVIEYENHWKTHIWIICQEGILLIQQVKLEWKKSMAINCFINGNKDFLDYTF
jgi:methionyl-tRNA formyltransferase